MGSLLKTFNILDFKGWPSKTFKYVFRQNLRNSVTNIGWQRQIGLNNTSLIHKKLSNDYSVVPLIGSSRQAKQLNLTDTGKQ